MHKAYLQAFLLALYVSSINAAPYLNFAGCGDGNDYWVADDDPNIFHRCWGFFGGSRAKYNCAPGSCVPPNFGRQPVASVPNPCTAHCSTDPSQNTNAGSPPAGTSDAPLIVTVDATPTRPLTFNNIGFPTYKWEELTGATPMPGTGPNGDHTTGTGKYYGAIALNGVNPLSDEAHLTTQAYSGLQPLKVDFWYHMNGANMGSLFVEILKSDGSAKQVWSASGDQGSQWRRVELAIPEGITGGYSVRFRAVYGTGLLGDIAIDDITIVAGEMIYATNCQDINGGKSKLDGLYTIRQLPSGQQTSYYCYMDLNGWTMIQQRVDGSMSFDKNWQSYVDGFGSPSGNFWMGLETIHRMSSPQALGPTQKLSLAIDLTTLAGQTYTAVYDSIYVDTPASKYTLNLGNYNAGLSDAGDALKSTGFASKNADGMKFSTPDQDNDLSPKHCAKQYLGGWWYNDCWYGNLNAPYTLAASCDHSCLGWETIGTGTTTFKKVVMRVKVV